MSTIQYILIEGASTADDRFHVARFELPAQALVSKVTVYRALHVAPISRGQAVSAIVDLNRGGTGRGPTMITEPAPAEDEDDPVV